MADSGEIIRDEWTTVGYLPQEGEALGEETVLEVATGRAGTIPTLEKTLRQLEEKGQCECIEYYEAQAKFDALNDPQFDAKAKKMLHGLGFSEEQFERPASDLSGGWVMRAHLARLLAMQPDLLMLDEPTNHLDLSALLWFQEHLKSQSCAVLLISHDRQFMDEIADKVFEFSDKKLFSGKAITLHTKFRRRRLSCVNQPPTKPAEGDQRNQGFRESIQKCFIQIGTSAEQAQGFGKNGDPEKTDPAAQTVSLPLP